MGLGAVGGVLPHRNPCRPLPLLQPTTALQGEIAKITDTLGERHRAKRHRVPSEKKRKTEGGPGRLGGEVRVGSVGE